MGRKVIDKVFDVFVRAEITVQLNATNKDEAEAWIRERFSEYLFINNVNVSNETELPKIVQINIKKIKRPRRFKSIPIVLPTGE